MARRKEVNEPIYKSSLVAPDQITYSEDFRFRASDLDAVHKADLASTIKNTGKALEPILLWREEGQPGSANLVLLDGAHRIAAYQAASWPCAIPAMIIDCDRRTALRVALSGNSRRKLQLTLAERMDAAWRLVREAVEPRYKVREIAEAADVSQRMVKYMRSRHRVMHEEDIEITGQWWRDRHSCEMADDPAQMMTEAQRNAEKETLIKDIRDLLDRRKHPQRGILRDGHLVEEAICDALGEKRVKSMVEYIFGSGDEVDDWMAFQRSDDSIGGDEHDADQEPEPAF